jgi:hypothetical protein
MYKSILLAVDGSEHSLANDCTIEAVYVVDYSKSKDEVLHS